MSNQQRRPGDEWNNKNIADIGWIGMKGWALCVLVFLHKGFGINALGLYGIAGLFVMAAAALALESEAIFTFMMLYLVMIVYRRAEAGRMERRGEIVHSQWLGEPIFARDDATTPFRAAMCDSGLCLLGGFAIGMISPPVGLFFASGSIPICFIYSVERAMLRQQMVIYRDMRIQQRHTMDVITTGRSDF